MTKVKGWAMLNNGDKNREDLLNKLIDQIHAKFPAAKAKLLTQFAHQCYSLVAYEDLKTRSLENLLGALLSLWQFVYTRAPGECKIRIYNPEFERDGWQSTRTVIEIVHDDIPFLVDSIRAAINDHDLLVHLMMYTGGMEVIRNSQRQITEILTADKALPDSIAEAPIYVEIERQTDPKEIASLKSLLESTLHDTQLAVTDWPKMKEQVQQTLVWLEHNLSPLNPTEVAESRDFLCWLLEGNFILLGCRDYQVKEKRGEKILLSQDETSLGILRHDNVCELPCYFSDLPSEAFKLALSSQILVFTKTDTKSTVHRSDYLDCIAVKRFDKAGQIVGERRFIGLYTSSSYRNNPCYVPVLRHKITQILEASHLHPQSYGYRSIKNILEDLPRDDLFQGSVQELLELAMGILHLQERQRIRLFIRKDIYNRFFSCLVFVPRDCFNTELRQKIWKILKDELAGRSIAFVTQFSGSALARIHFIVRVDPNKTQTYDVAEIEKKLVAIGYTWQDQLKERLIDYYGESKGVYYANRYRRAFPASYREQFDSRTAVHDIAHIENLSSDHLLSLSFYQPLNQDEESLHFKLFRHRHNIPLSDVLPMFENLGLRIIDECPHRITLQDGTCAWINDFEMMYVDKEGLDIQAVRDILQEAFIAVWYATAENDSFNKLVLAGKLSWREVAVLRAYMRYFKQIGFTFSQRYVAETLIANANVARYLIDLFNARFDPKGKHGDSLLEIIENKITQALDNVSSLDQDRILRKYLNIIKATVRTNYFQTDSAGEPKSYISFKLDPSKIAELPCPHPKHEIFVYSPRFEGVHLRADKVARGGLRWSDRREDFRTEILGLMKAQQVKNALIIPQGAKGGFVAKCLPKEGSRDEILEEGIYCYCHFIKGLLDLTDNLKDKQIVAPNDVVCYDEEDPYLVVAADKGTATFSDRANQIAKEYNFWLDDAFASGGSTGYDHKRMGITARGVWESVKRHFRELKHDVQAMDFTVVGIGDMSGDVFGNGMLLSKHIQLVVAFNHMHIFIDPTPNPETSFAERQRLFSLPRSTWADYNPRLISPGGGVFRRSAKFIKLTPEIKKLFNLSKDFMVPSDLLRVILKAKVDLLYNGGIGTFVKAAKESHEDVGDRTNDAIRVNANELRCKVIAEGGNLGLTQLARVEYELKGGHVYTDFIDNSAGVDCSDHEINIKILLNHVIEQGDMTVKQRNKLLGEMTDQVAELVLKNNTRQTQAISLAKINANHKIDLYDNFIKTLEESGQLDRELEFLPDENDILARKTADQGLTQPELAILMAYGKNALKKEILHSDLPEDPYLSKMLLHEFPRPLRLKYYAVMKSHSLYREIIATQLTNDLLDRMSFTFMYRLRDETGASVLNIIKAYAIVKRIFAYDILWQEIESLGASVDIQAQLTMLRKVNRLIRRATRWFLCHRSDKLDIETAIKQFERPVDNLVKKLPIFLMKADKDVLMGEVKELVDQGVPEKLAKYVSYCPLLLPSLDIVQAALDSDFSVREVAIAYFIIGNLLDLDWFRQALIEYEVESRWDALARVRYRDDLDRQQRLLTIAALRSRASRKSIRECVEYWAKEQSDLINRWQKLLGSLKAASTLEPTMFSVGLSGLNDLSQSCVQSQERL